MQSNATSSFNSFFIDNGIKRKTVVESEETANASQLLHYERLHELIASGLSGGELAVEIIGHHLSILTTMIEHKITGHYAIELTLSCLLSHSEFYADIVALARKNGIYVKVHIVLNDEDTSVEPYNTLTLKQQFAPIVAAQVKFAIENIDSIENVELSHQIIDIAEEIRVDLANNGAANLSLIQAMLDKVSNGKKSVDQYGLPPTAFDSSILSYKITKID